MAGVQKPLPRNPWLLCLVRTAFGGQLGHVLPELSNLAHDLLVLPQVRQDLQNAARRALGPSPSCSGPRQAGQTGRSTRQMTEDATARVMPS